MGKTTSITLKKNIVSLWILLIDIELSESKIKQEITNFVYECANIWEGKSAKGFSDFITEQIILSILEESDSKKYHQIKRILD